MGFWLDLQLQHNDLGLHHAVQLHRRHRRRPALRIIVAAHRRLALRHDLCRRQRERQRLLQHRRRAIGGLVGVGGCGTVFTFNIGAKAFINLQTTSGKVGSKVGIFGQGFSSSSVVKFNGVTAISVTRSGTTYLTATVPAGATSGFVTVKTGSTTLTSAQKFTVHDSWSSGRRDDDRCAMADDRDDRQQDLRRRRSGYRDSCRRQQSNLQSHDEYMDYGSCSADGDGAGGFRRGRIISCMFSAGAPTAVAQ